MSIGYRHGEVSCLPRLNTRQVGFKAGRQQPWLILVECDISLVVPFTAKLLCLGKLCSLDLLPIMSEKSILPFC